MSEVTRYYEMPATRIDRAGHRRVVGNRTRWERAIEGHTNAVHCGKVDKKCAACIELLKRKKEAAR